MLSWTQCWTCCARLPWLQMRMLGAVASCGVPWWHLGVLRAQAAWNTHAQVQTVIEGVSMI